MSLPLTRQQFLLSGIPLLLGERRIAAEENGLRGKYIDPRYQTAIGFGAISPYLLPWRAYQETLPVSALKKAIGINLNIDRENPSLILRHLADCGVRHGRIEFGWGGVFAGSDESALSSEFAQRIRPLLEACKANSVRPLILLNGNHGVPCPMTNSDRVLAKPAQKGDRVAYLTETRGLIKNHSGFNHVTQYKACEVLFTNIESSGRVELSRPLPKDLGGVGKSVSVGTLRYLPIGFPSKLEMTATRNGWKRYVNAVAHFVGSVIGNGDDRGFDMEVWNELSFGSDFLFAQTYFDPNTFRKDPQWETNLVELTAQVAESDSKTFAGVEICDGMSNTIPWTDAASEPARVHALSKHPYTGKTNNHGKPKTGFSVINALFHEEKKPSFYPTFTSAAPETAASAQQTEYIVRDLSPITTPIYKAQHGRFARGTGNKQVRLWFTEWGMSPKDWGVADRDAAQNLKAKAFLRTICFHVNKGLERLYFYAVRGGDSELGVVSDRFLAHARTETIPPENEASFRSTPLATLKRLVDAISSEEPLKATRPLIIEDIRDSHGQYQWQGDGTAEHPTMYNRECFAFLPFQTHENKFVLAYYIQTLDITKSLSEATYTVLIRGFLNPEKVFLNRLYDPLTGKNVPHARILYTDARGVIALSLPTTDYPYLLFLEET